MVKYDYTTKNTISNKVSWKILSTLTDYDFLNMLPSMITYSDLSNLDPFQTSFQSQRIVDSQGKQLYPKKTYTVGATDDQNGIVVVQVKYEYVPMFATTSNYQSNVKSYTTSTTYTTFKKSDTASFKFASQTSSNTTTTIDVNNVSELKSLVKTSVLPSSFESLNNSHSSTNSDFYNSLIHWLVKVIQFQRWHLKLLQVIQMEY